MTRWMIISWKCLFARRKTASSVGRTNCEFTPAENRAGNTRARSDSFFALHGALPLRSGAGLLFAKRGAFREGWRFLHIERCARGFRAIAGPAVRRNVASSGLTGKHRLGGAWARARIVCARRTWLGANQIPRFLSRVALRPC